MDQHRPPVEFRTVEPIDLSGHPIRSHRPGTTDTDVLTSVPTEPQRRPKKVQKAKKSDRLPYLERTPSASALKNLHRARALLMLPWIALMVHGIGGYMFDYEVSKLIVAIPMFIGLTIIVIYATILVERTRNLYQRYQNELMPSTRLTIRNQLVKWHCNVLMFGLIAYIVLVICCMFLAFTQAYIADAVIPMALGSHIAVAAMMYYVYRILGINTTIGLEVDAILAEKYVSIHDTITDDETDATDYTDDTALLPITGQPVIIDYGCPSNEWHARTGGPAELFGLPPREQQIQPAAPVQPLPDQPSVRWDPAPNGIPPWAAFEEGNPK